MDMTWYISTYTKHYPTHWAKFDDYIKKHSAKSIGFPGGGGCVNLFAARYRIAKGFQNISVDDARQNLVDAYSSLTKNLLTWGAFECFMDALCIEQKDCDSFLNQFPCDDWAIEIRNIENSIAIFQHLSNHVNKTHKAHIDAFIKTSVFNFSYLSSGIRHTFAHGSMTPNSGNCHPEIVVQVCNFIADKLLFVLDSEFSNRIESFERSES